MIIIISTAVFAPQTVNGMTLCVAPPSLIFVSRQLLKARAVYTNWRLRAPQRGDRDYAIIRKREGAWATRAANYDL